MTFLTQDSEAVSNVPTRHRLLLLAMAAATFWLGIQTVATVQTFVLTARVGMTTRFEISSIRFDQETRDISVLVAVTNPSATRIVLEDLRLSVYSAAAFIFTNSESRFDRPIEPSATEVFEMRLVLEPYFAKEVNPGQRWYASGRAYLNIPSIRPKIPVRLRLEYPAHQGAS